MQALLYTMASVAAVSICSLAGVATLALSRERLRRILLYLVSFAVGGLFGDAFIHLLPESFRVFGFGITVPLYVISGLLVFFVLEKFILWRHCHDEDCSAHRGRVVAVNILVSDTVHNLIDGMLIGASYSVSVPIGIATTIAVVLHEIPQETGDFGILVHAGLSVRRALFFNFISALVSFVGAFLAIAIGSRIHGFANALLPITAGGFIYIAGSDLIPELHHDAKIKTSLGQLLCIMMGIGIMVIIMVVE